MKKRLIDFLIYFIGGMLVAASISCFAAPNNIAAGGFSGIATLVNYISGFPIGIAVILMNVPVFIIGARSYGLKFLYKTLIATASMSIMIDLFGIILPVYRGDRLLAAIIGGVVSGVGLGVVFIRGATTGGLDIIAKLINDKFSNLSMGQLILALDALVIFTAAIIYKNIESTLYAAIMLYVQSKAIDAIVYGVNKGKVLLISSKNSEKIAENIMNELHRGVTLIDAKGAYTKKFAPLIMCAVRPYEAAALRQIVKKADENAFIITLDAANVSGEGFPQK